MTIKHSHELIEGVMTSWRKGVKYGHISEKFEISKCAVGGIVARNRKPDEKSILVIGRPRVSQTPRPVRPTGCLPDKIKRSVISGIRFKSCQWIKGEPSADDRCKCGVKTGKYGIYCMVHEMCVGYIK